MEAVDHVLIAGEVRLAIAAYLSECSDPGVNSIAVANETVIDEEGLHC